MNSRINDYEVFEPKTKTAITELCGLRPTQEDRVAVGQLPELLSLPSNKYVVVLDRTIESLQKRIAEQKLDAGSTLCTTLLIGKTVIHANVGDSESFLIVRDSKNEILTFERISTKLHDINNDNVAQLLRDGFKVVKGRLFDPKRRSGINMYRAMGDLMHEDAGMQHKPDIYVFDVDIPEGGNAFVINACDGLTEKMSHTQLEKMLRDYKDVALEDLSGLLANAAISLGSTDNVSVMITPVEVDAKPKYISVFDGHGGSSVSSFLERTFHIMLVLQCKLHALYDADREARISNQLKLVELERIKQVKLAKEFFDRDLPRLLQCKPFSQTILAEAKEASLQIDDDNVDVNDTINKLLFSLYIQIYMTSRARGLFSHSTTNDNITPWLVEKLKERCPDIYSIVLPKGIQNTEANRILWYAGEKYKDFAPHILHELQTFEEVSGQQSSDEHKAMFINKSKLLGRLGNNGFQACSVFFCGVPGHHVKEKEIEKYYKMNLAPPTITQKKRNG